MNSKCTKSCTVIDRLVKRHIKRECNCTNKLGCCSIKRWSWLSVKTRHIQKKRHQELEKCFQTKFIKRWNKLNLFIFKKNKIKWSQNAFMVCVPCFENWCSCKCLKLILNKLSSVPTMHKILNKRKHLKNYPLLISDWTKKF